MNFQEMIFALKHFWSSQGCIIQEPYDVEKGAGTMNPATFLRTLGPEPWHVKVVEGNRERIQIFEGLVIGRQNGGVRETFTVRRISYGIGVERTFLVHSPRLARIEVVRRGIVRRAKLHYLRGLTGKAARIREKRS